MKIIVHAVKVSDTEKQLRYEFTQGDPRRAAALDAALLQAEAFAVATRILTLRAETK